MAYLNEAKDASTDASELQKALHQLRRDCTTAEELAQRASNLVDRMLPQPPPVPIAGGAEHHLKQVSSGRLAEFEDALRTLNNNLQDIGRHLERLSGIL